MELPNNWVLAEMPRIVKWGSGGTPKTDCAEYYNGTIPWIVIGDMNDGLIITSEKHISEAGLNASSAKFVEIGSVMLAMYGSIGKLGIAGVRLTTNQAIAFTQQLFGITNKYLFYYLFLQKNKLMSMDKGGTQKNISQTVINALKVPLAPLAEQNRIVAKIDALFSKLDKGVETLQTVRQQLRTYRQAVLKWAFEGKEWATVPFSQIATLVTSGSRGWAKYYSDDGAMFIRIGNLTRDGINLELDNVQYVSLPNNAEGLRARLQKGDMLISITADLGSIGVVPVGLGEAYINQHIALARLKNPHMVIFYAWYLKSQIGRKELLKNMRGATKIGLGLDDIRGTFVPDVTESEASQVVAMIKSRLSVCDKLEHLIDETLEKTQALRQSILKKAFSGRLVPQGPIDESAENLLKRIKTEQEIVIMKSKSKRKGK